MPPCNRPPFQSGNGCWSRNRALVWTGSGPHMPLSCEFVRQSLILVFDLADLFCLLGYFLLGIIKDSDQLSMVFHELADSGPEFFLFLG
jgi:hypothetical protein